MSKDRLGLKLAGSRAKLCLIVGIYRARSLAQSRGLTGKKESSSVEWKAIVFVYGGIAVARLAHTRHRLGDVFRTSVKAVRCWAGLHGRQVAFIATLIITKEGQHAIAMSSRL